MGIKLTVSFPVFQIIVTFGTITISITWEAEKKTKKAFFEEFSFVLMKLKVVTAREKSLKTIKTLCVSFSNTNIAMCNSSSKN